MPQLPPRVPLTARDLAFLRTLHQADAAKPAPDPVVEIPRQLSTAGWHTLGELACGGHLRTAGGAAALHHVVAPLVRRSLVHRQRRSGLTRYCLAPAGRHLLGALVGPAMAELAHCGSSAGVDCYAEAPPGEGKVWAIVGETRPVRPRLRSGAGFWISVRRQSFGDVVFAEYTEPGTRPLPADRVTEVARLLLAEAALAAAAFATGEDQP